jgi:tRNA (guanine-N7-)-methyltransferase
METSAQPETLIYKIESIVQRLDFARLFQVTQPVEVELGAGDGSFTNKYAATHRDKNIIAVERLLGRLRKIDKKGRRDSLKNLRCIRIEGSYFLEYMLPRKSVAALHIYFPDPWPKRKHRHHRLVNERFTELAALTLQSKGIVYLRTDDADYFEQMNRVFNANAKFEKIETPRQMLEIVTDFERNFHLRGVPTLAVAYRLKD